jgi:hypothetical protein
MVSELVSNSVRHLVEALAHRWGVTREGFTRVWIELDCRPSRDQQAS